MDMENNDFLVLSVKNKGVFKIQLKTYDGTFVDVPLGSKYTSDKKKEKEEEQKKENFGERIVSITTSERSI